MISRNVYDPDNRQARIKFAANVISAGSRTTRNFDSCFEMGDGAEVAAALYARADKRPDTRFARNLPRYVVRPEHVEVSP